MEKLVLGFNRALGRNRGLISSYHRERGKKNNYKIIDFNRNLLDIKGKIKFIIKDRYRSSYLAGVSYTNGYFSYILLVHGMKIGDYIINKSNINLKNDETQLGISCQLKYVKIGYKIHNLEYFPGSGGKVSRSAGTFSKIIKKYDTNALIKLSSGEYRLFYKNCICTIGRVSNISHNEEIIKKAGINRLLGWRPIVRGRAMNPVDHPHGGRTNGGISPRTPWGLLTRGIKTVKIIKSNIIKKRKK